MYNRNKNWKLNLEIYEKNIVSKKSFGINKYKFAS